MKLVEDKALPEHTGWAATVTPDGQCYVFVKRSRCPGRCEQCPILTTVQAELVGT